jgi:hypothetical protein
MYINNKLRRYKLRPNVTVIYMYITNPRIYRGHLYGGAAAQNAT